jgi:hypothetical protein
MKRFVSLFLFCILIFLGTSCSKSSTNDQFDLSIKIVNQSGNPLTGYEVGVTNLMMQRGSTEVRSNPIITYQLEKTYNVKLKVYDIENNLVKTLVDERVVGGLHSIPFDCDKYVTGEPLIGNTLVFKYCLEVHLDRGIPLYEHSKYMCKYDKNGTIGLTDNSGYFRITDKRIFPYFYDFPEMLGVDEHGETTNIFTFSNNMLITVVNPELETYMTFTKQIKSNNDFTFTWDNSKAKPLSTLRDHDHEDDDDDDGDDDGDDNDGNSGDIDPLETKLIGCYPNPYK